MLHRIKLLGLGAIVLLLCIGLIIVTANGCGKKGGGKKDTSAGSSTPPPVTYPSSPFSLLGFVNNGYQDSNLWFGKYVSGVLDTGTEEFIAKDLDISLMESPIAFVRDASNNIYVISSNANGANGYFFAKYNGTTGVLIWKHVMTARLMKIKEKSGIIYLGGILENVKTTNSDDIWCAAYDTNGVLQWEVTKNSIGKDNLGFSADYFIDFAIDNSGAVYVLGNTVNVSDKFEIWLGKVNATGSGWQWELTKTQSASWNALATALALDNAGDVYALGSVDYGGSTGYDIWLGKPMADGSAWAWQRTKNGSRPSGIDNATALALDNLGDIYVLGRIDDGSDEWTQDFNIWLGRTKTDGSSGWNWDITKAGIANDDDYPTALVVSGANAYVLGNTKDIESANDIWLGMTTAGISWNWNITKTGTADTPMGDSGTALAVYGDKAYVLGTIDVAGYPDSDIWLGTTTNGTSWGWEAQKDGDDNAGDVSTALVLDAAGIPYVIGSIENPSTDIWLGKGNIGGIGWSWQITKTNIAVLGASYDRSTDLLIDGSNNVYVLGSISNIDIGAGTDTATYYDIWLGKTANGTSWTWQTERKSVSVGKVIQKTDAEGNIYVATTIQQYTPITKQIISLSKYNSAFALQWELTKGGSNIREKDGVVDLLIDITGVYVTGWINNSGTGDDIWLGKASADGLSWEWNLTKDYTGYEDKPTTMAIDGTGNVYVLGHIYDDVDSWSDDIWLGKAITTGGAADWNWDIVKDGLGGTDIPKSLAIDALGNVYVMGEIDNGGTGYDIWIAKAASDGLSWEWERTKNNDAEDGNDSANSLALDTTGNLYALGQLGDSGGNYDIWLAKVITDGSDYSWELTENTSTNPIDTVSALTTDNSGNVYVVGKVWGGVNNTNYAIWAAKVNSDGEDWEWEITKTSPATLTNMPVAWTIDNSGNFYIMGKVVNTGALGSANIWFAKYSAGGVLQYEIEKNGSYNLDDTPINFGVDSYGNAYIYGELPSRENGKTIWLGKYNPDGSFGFEITKTGTEEGRIFSLIPEAVGWILGKKIE